MLSKHTPWINIKKTDRYRAISDLVRESRGTNLYYSLLVLSSIIITAGLLLANSAILIGGMLVAPVLTPILLISLGIVTSRTRVIKNTAKLILKSMGIIFVVSFLASLMFDTPENTEFFSSSLFNNTISSAFLYFLVALASGVAATLSWIRKEVSNVLPGISIAVSLVPPVALVGIWLAQNNIDAARFYFVVFLFNLFGIIMSSMVIFSMLRFYNEADEVLYNSNQANKMDRLSKKNNNENSIS